MRRVFHYRDFNLSTPDEQVAYERLMQAARVDRPQDFEIIAEAGTWTKAGEHMVAVSYVENEPEDGAEAERY
jgi:hypothetical protein